MIALVIIYLVINSNIILIFILFTLIKRKIIAKIHILRNALNNNLFI